jgi:hypothetical protein
MQNPSRPLTLQEQSWIKEILDGHPEWSELDPSNTRVTAESVTGNARTVKLSTGASPIPSLRGTNGYLGRVEIRTADNFGITITLDQHDGSLEELYVDFLDLEESGDRPRPREWQELAHVNTKM